jgi:2Fe-2S ferredoxin
MPTITVKPHAILCPEGKTFEADVSLSVCENLLRNGIQIEHACEMVCACTTCHVIVESGFDKLNSISEREDDMLDQAWGLQSNSRLSCQSFLNKDHIVIEIPKYTINHAREK